MDCDLPNEHLQENDCASIIPDSIFSSSKINNINKKERPISKLYNNNNFVTRASLFPSESLNVAQSYKLCRRNTSMEVNIDSEEELFDNEQEEKCADNSRNKHTPLDNVAFVECFNDYISETKVPRIDKEIENPFEEDYNDDIINTSQYTGNNSDVFKPKKSFAVFKETNQNTKIPCNTFTQNLEHHNTKLRQKTDKEIRENKFPNFSLEPKEHVSNYLDPNQIFDNGNVNPQKYTEINRKKNKSRKYKMQISRKPVRVPKMVQTKMHKFFVAKENTENVIGEDAKRFKKEKSSTAKENRKLTDFFNTVKHTNEIEPKYI